MDRLLRIPEVCERLNHGRTRVYQLLASGRLPSVVVGPRARRVRESDLQAFIESLNDGVSPATGAVPHDLNRGR